MRQLAPPDWGYTGFGLTVVGLGAALWFANVGAEHLVGPILMVLGLLLMLYSLRPPLRSLLRDRRALIHADLPRRQRRALLRPAAARMIRAYNELTKLGQLQEPGSETYAQRSARAQLEGLSEKYHMEALRSQLWEYREAIPGLGRSARRRHQSIYERLSRAKSLADLHEPIRELHDLLFSGRRQ
jgi:hypothetical protein